MSQALGAPSSRAQQSRAFWLKHLHQWHWISAALCMAGMLLFSFTGFTLNHASAISAAPEVSMREAQLPEGLLEQLQMQWEDEMDEAAALPADMARWLQQELSVQIGTATPEWSDDEIYVSLPRPGGDAWLNIDLVEGAATYELTDRGWVSYLNDLHKGRNTGAGWSLFIDLVALAAIVFSITGLLLLKMHATNRAATWPLVGLGLVAPLLLALLFIH